LGGAIPPLNLGEIDMELANQYKLYEAEITKLKKQLEEIYELLVGDNGIKRYTHEELIDHIKVINDQIADWQDGETEEREATLADKDLTEEEEWCKQKGNHTTDEMNGEEITR
jgi:hypothetical protein